MGNKNIIRQELCLLNLYAISCVGTWNLKIMKYSLSTMIAHSSFFEINAALFQPL